MEYKRLCETDYRFLSVIWDNEPLTSAKLVELCGEQFGWKKSTTYTMIKKLCEKGFAKSEKTVVTSLVPRSQVQEQESELFMRQTFNGSLPGFLTAFLGGKTISAEDAEELKRLIDEHREA